MCSIKIGVPPDGIKPSGGTKVLASTDVARRVPRRGTEATANGRRATGQGGLEGLLRLLLVLAPPRAGVDDALPTDDRQAEGHRVEPLAAGVLRGLPRLREVVVAEPLDDETLRGRLDDEEVAPPHGGAGAVLGDLAAQNQGGAERGDLVLASGPGADLVLLGELVLLDDLAVLALGERVVEDPAAVGEDGHGHRRAAEVGHDVGLGGLEGLCRQHLPGQPVEGGLLVGRDLGDDGIRSGHWETPSP